MLAKLKIPHVRSILKAIVPEAIVFLALRRISADFMS